jgi:A/G-specific adenine glycosylase
MSPAARGRHPKQGSTPSPAQVAAFRDQVWALYREQGRHGLPWRQTRDPWAVLVSEVMLQQTQVSRVEPAFLAFLDEFPTPEALDAAPLASVLRVWQGLGYNRRALWLKQSAQILSERFGGIVPADLAALRSLPGVGAATAAGVLVFAFGIPAPYLETNVRAAYLHHFFGGEDVVGDSAVLRLVDKTMDRVDPRDWFYALLDYGAWLKKTVSNPSRRSAHHARQSRFEGSWRQKRACVLRAVVNGPPRSADEIASECGLVRLAPGEAIAVLEELQAEGFVAREGGDWVIACDE